VNWDTTAKTTGFTAVSGVGYFCDTTSAGFTVTLPATPSAGDIVGLVDYAGTFDTNALVDRSKWRRHRRWYRQFSINWRERRCCINICRFNTRLVTYFRN
jgi:hypothetical protein